MTEAEWLTCDDPDSLWALYTSEQAWRLGIRTARLFSVAFLRTLRDFGWPGSDQERAHLELAERYADGLATREDLTRAASQNSSP